MVVRVGSLNQGNNVAAQTDSLSMPTRICRHIELVEARDLEAQLCDTWQRSADEASH